MNAPTSRRIFFVDPARFVPGRWCHERDRQIAEGDISASYSADKIALEGRVRSPFTWEKVYWVSVGGSANADNRSVEAYRLVPVRFYEGTPISYRENSMLGGEARARPEGFYHGMSVKHGKEDYVLVGPCALFFPCKHTEMPTQTSLLDLL